MSDIVTGLPVVPTTLTGALGLVFALVLLGWLIPRRTYMDRIEDMAARVRDKDEIIHEHVGTIRTLQEVGRVQGERLDEMLENSRLAVAVLRAMQDAADRKHKDGPA